MGNGKVIRTRSKAAYALVRNDQVIGYAHSQSARVIARVQRLRARLVPIADGKVVID